MVYSVKKGDVQAAKDFTENERMILRKGRFVSTLAEFEEIVFMFCLFVRLNFNVVLNYQGA